MASGGLGCYKHATPSELLCPGLIPPETAMNQDQLAAEAGYDVNRFSAQL